jgi:LysR family glycine cleavage system transcriptional activator
VQASRNLTSLRAFHALVQHGNAVAAADALNVTPGAIRHQLRRLEEDLGQPLVVRNKRVLTLTRRGASLHETIARAFSDIANACRPLQSGTAEGELRIACAPAFAAFRLMRMVDAFAQTHPLMDVRLFALDQADQTMDVIIAYGERDVPGARIAVLRDEIYFPVCSPALAYAQDINRPSDLSGLVGLHADGGMDWSRLSGASSHQPIRFRQEMFFPNAALSLQAAREGCGVAVGTSILCSDDLRRGTLVRLLDIEVPAPTPYFIIRPDAGRNPAADEFVEQLNEHIRVTQLHERD